MPPYVTMPLSLFQLINYAMGFAVCVVIGLLYVVFLPLCGCCFCCCRCCGNCGGDLKAVTINTSKEFFLSMTISFSGFYIQHISALQEYDDNEDCKRMGFAQAVFLLAVLMT